MELGRGILHVIRDCYAQALGFNDVLQVLTTFDLLSPAGGALLPSITTVLTVANASTLARHLPLFSTFQKTGLSVTVE